MSQDGHSTQIQRCIDRLRTGDPSRATSCYLRLERLTRLTRKMLRDYPGVRRWEQTDDVLQNALLRLCRALDDVQPPTVPDFFRLAALQIRRELIDMARRYSAPAGWGPTSLAPTGRSRRPRRTPTRPDTTRDPDRLAIWTGFHLAAEALAEEERRGVRLALLPGADTGRGGRGSGCLRGHHRGRWRPARMQLVQSLGGMLPGL